MRRNSFILLFMLVGLISLSSFIAFRYGPTYFPSPHYNFYQEPPDAKKIELGRKLFYDPIFSKDSSISCASCHSPFNAFAHTDHDLSHGIHDSIGTRNAPALFNLAWQKNFMWDGAINHLDMQPLAPIEHPGEMAETLKNIAQKLAQNKKYAQAFSATYGDNDITGARILKLLSQFQLSLISASAKYDSVLLGQSKYTAQEKKGAELFQDNCSSCHVPPLFSSYQFANNGLKVDTTLNDFGRWQVTGKSEDSLTFKIPSLRNLSYTFPYMHDGRFDKLRQVLNHYDQEIINSPTLAPQLKNKMPLSSNEKTDIIAFLLTLNDPSFVFNKKHGFPKMNHK